MRKNFHQLILAIMTFAFGCDNQNKGINPVLMPITESVYSSITIQPDSIYAVYAAIGGIIGNTYVEEGDLIKKGDAILSIVNDSRELDKENAKLSFEQAKANYEGNTSLLDELKNELETAELQFRNDSLLYEKQCRLWDQNIGSKNEHDQKKLAYEVSHNNWQTVKRKYERTKRELRTQLLQAENTYYSNLRLNKNYVLTSYINGKVYQMLKNPGESVSDREPVAYVGSKDRFIIEMQVDEVDIVKIRLGQKVLIVLDAYGEEVFEAKVSKITPNMDSRSQTFLVESTFDLQPEVLYSGLTGEANVIISQKEEAITIPLSYLADKNKVKTKDGLIEIETGLQNLDRVEVIHGLTIEDVLLEP